MRVLIEIGVGIILMAVVFVLGWCANEKTHTDPGKNTVIPLNCGGGMSNPATKQ